MLVIRERGKENGWTEVRHEKLVLRETAEANARFLRE